MGETVPLATGGQQWRPDVLGPGFEQLELPLGSDDEGEVVATLVRHRPEPVRPVQVAVGAAA